MLKFRKIIHHSHRSGTTIAHGFEYNIPDIGQLVFTGQAYQLSCGSKQYTINRSLQVVDTSTLDQVGNYHRTFFAGYKNKLTWRGQDYTFKKIKPDVRYSLFNKNTWGHFKFQLSNADERITYQFRINLPAISLGNAYMEKSFEGQLDIQQANPEIALAGLFLVEQALDREIVA